MAVLFDPLTEEETAAIFERADDHRALANWLERNGWQVVWDQERARALARLSCPLAATDYEGERWPLQRAAWQDGYARWARTRDLTFFAQLEGALMDVNRAGDAHTAHGYAYERLLDTIKRMRPQTLEELQALETIARLGTLEQLRAMLGFGDGRG